MRRYLDVVSTARGLSPVNRRRALATLAVGVFAPNVLAACVGGPAKQAEKAKPPEEAALTFRPADKTTTSCRPRRSVSRSATAGSSTSR